MDDIRGDDLVAGINGDLQGDINWFYAPIPGEDALTQFTIPMETVYRLYVFIHNIGYPTAMELIHFAGWLMKELLHAGVSDIDDTFEGFFFRLAGYTDRGKKGIQSDEDLVLSFTYGRLAQKRITWEQAAAFATKELRSETPFTPDAWRMKVKRWQKRQGLPPVAMRQRHTNTDEEANTS